MRKGGGSWQVWRLGEGNPGEGAARMNGAAAHGDVEEKPCWVESWMVSGD